MEKIYFKEVQRFSQWWFLLLIFASFAIAPVLLVAELLGGAENVDGQNSILTSLSVVLAIEVPIIWLLLKMNLTVEVRSTGVWYRYPPLLFKWKRISPLEIESFEVISYKPVKDYGGWGIKGTRKKRAYSVSGNSGLRMHLVDGKSILLGTLQKNSMKLAMDRMMKANTSL